MGILALLSAAPALAQFPGLPSSAVPSSVVPGRDVIEGQTEAPARRETRRVRVEGDIERSPCALADPAYADIRITPTRFTFNNLGPVDAAELTPLTQRYLNSEQQIGIICEVRDAAATLLRDKGYIAAVQVPAQRIENGEVRLEVLYARVSDVAGAGRCRAQHPCVRALSEAADAGGRVQPLRGRALAVAGARRAGP
jgi:hemolysin activation/secretion protein